MYMINRAISENLKIFREKNHQRNYMLQKENITFMQKKSEEEKNKLSGGKMVYGIPGKTAE